MFIFLSVVFLFFNIFSFGIGFENINSVLLSIMLLPFIYIFNPLLFSKAISLLRQKKIWFIPFVYLVVIFLSLLIIVLYGTYDYRMIVTWVNNLLSYWIMLLFCVYFIANTNKYDRFYIALKVINIVFIIQVVMVIVMLISPDIRSTIQEITKSEAIVEKMSQYMGVRGLGVTGMAAFGLAIIMGLYGFLLSYSLSISSRYNIYIKSIVYCLTLIAALSAGRTAILGFVLGAPFILINTSIYKILLLKYKLIFVLFVFFIVYYIVYNDSIYIKSIIDTYSAYAFQPINNFIKTGTFNTTSTSHLIEKMYFPLSESQIFFGDGKYINIDGSYYLYTDAGFMRFTLFFGSFVSLFVYFSFVIYLYLFNLNIKRYIKNNTYFIFCLGVLSFIYHYKGEVILFNVAYFKIISFLFIITLCQNEQIKK